MGHHDGWDPRRRRRRPRVGTASPSTTPSASNSMSRRMAPPFRLPFCWSRSIRRAGPAGDPGGTGTPALRSSASIGSPGAPATGAEPRPRPSPSTSPRGRPWGRRLQLAEPLRRSAGPAPRSAAQLDVLDGRRSSRPPGRAAHCSTTTSSARAFSSGSVHLRLVRPAAAPSGSSSRSGSRCGPPTRPSSRVTVRQAGCPGAQRTEHAGRPPSLVRRPCRPSRPWMVGSTNGWPSTEI